MKLIKFKKNSYMLKVSREEAVRIAKSLLAQIDSNDSNSNRDEYYPEGCEYFSIAVDPIIDKTWKKLDTIFFKSKLNWPKILSGG